MTSGGASTASVATFGAGGQGQKHREPEECEAVPDTYRAGQDLASGKPQKRPPPRPHGTRLRTPGGAPYPRAMGTRLTEPIQTLARTRHLLIDLDGTLLSARDLPLTIDFITQVIRAFRPKFPWYRTIRALRALNDDLRRPAPEDLRDLTNDRRAAHILATQVGVPVEAAERILRETVPVIFPSLKRHFYPRRNAIEFLAWARETYGPENLTLATNPVWPEELVRLRMEWAGIDPGLFGWISHAGVMHACKPTPEYYAEVLRLRGLEAADCALVGNDLKMDVPATRLGIPVFIVADEARLARLPVSQGAAPAWRGDFAAIRRALETARRAHGLSS